MPGTTTSTVSGRVVDGTGLPVQGATVAVMSSDQPHRDIAALTAADGTFRLGGVPSGEAVLEARKSGATGSAAVEVTEDDESAVEISIG